MSERAKDFIAGALTVTVGIAISTKFGEWIMNKMGLKMEGVHFVVNLVTAFLMGALFIGLFVCIIGLIYTSSGPITQLGRSVRKIPKKLNKKGGT